MNALKADLKQKTFKPVYLLYGEERYLVAHYARAIGDALLPDASQAYMNRDCFDGKEAAPDDIIDAANTLPFLADTRVVYVRDSQLFTAGRKDHTDALADYLPQAPETTVLVFVETDVDKRNRLYKQAAALGRAVECAPPAPGELLKWVQNICQKKGQSISADTARYFLQRVPHAMVTAQAEAEKAAAHAGGGTAITPADIDAVCCADLETRIFDLIGAAAGGQGPKALRLYRNMLLLKESPLMVLTMMARQFRLILFCKAAQTQKMPSADIARTLSLRGFVVDECLRQGRLFTQQRLIQALRDCLDMDIRIKTGLMNAELGVEVLILKYAGR